MTQIEGFRCAPQQRRWFVAAGGRPAAAQVIVELTGPARADLLEAALVDVVRRHDALRTTFHAVPGMAFPVQVIAQPAVAWQRAAAPVASAEAARWVDEVALGERARSADLAIRPSVRAVLVRAPSATGGGERCALLVTLPAACADAASLCLLPGELARAYAARCGGAQPDGDPLSYLQFAEFQNEQEDAGPDDAARAFWDRVRGRSAARSRVAHRGSPSPAPELGRLDHSGAGAGAIDARRLAACAQIAGSTPEAFLLACWQVVIARFADADEVVIGCERDGRRYEDLDGAIGVFGTCLPLHAQIDGDRPVAELARHAARELDAGDAAQEHIPAAVAQDASWRAIGFAWRAIPDDAMAAGVVFSVGQLHEPRGDRELLLVCQHRGDRIAWTMHHDRGAYASATIARIARAFDRLVAEALARPDAPIAELAITSPDDEREVLALADGPAVPSPSHATVHALIAAQVARTPDAIAVELGDASLSYRELGARAARIAGALRALGIGHEARVGLCADRTLDLVPAVLGILATGAAYVPIDPTEPAERVAGMLSDVAASVVLTDASLAAAQPAGAWRIETLEHALTAAPVEPAGVGPDTAAYVIFTSGSTGRPKGVEVEHASLVSYLAWVNAELYGDTVEVIPALTRLSFDASLKQLLAPLLRGGVVCLVPSGAIARPDALIDVLATRRRVGLNCVPTLLRGVLDAVERRPGHPVAGAIASVLVGGEAVSRELVDRAHAAFPGCRVVNLYGPTEATANASFADLPPGQPVTVGRPVGNTRLYIVDARDRLVPLGVAGELWIGGAGVARGYVGDPDKTRARFGPDPFSALPGARIYRTGDRARYTIDGRIELLGRIDQQVKIRGFRVEPGEVAAVLEQHPEVREAAVVAGEDGAGNRRLIAYVAPASGAAGSGRTALEDTLRRFARTRLPEYMIPAVFVPLAALPRNATGKLDHRALPPAATVADVEYAAPATPAEHILVEIWAKVLRRSRVGIHDNFFALGGDSIQSVEASYLASHAGLAVTPRLLLQHQTIAELARATASEPTADAGASSLAPVALRPDADERLAPFPMTDLQQAYWIGRSAAFELGSVGPSSYVELEYAELDLARLERAWHALIARHEMLRTVALSTGELKVLAEVPPYRLDVLDLSAAEPADQRRELDAIRDRMTHQVMDPTTWPLFEVRATRLSGGRVRVHVSRDLLLTDVQSSQILLRELGRLYDDPSAELPALDIAFRDYVVSVAASTAGPSPASLAYWRDRLATLPDAPALPFVDTARVTAAPRFVARQATLDPGAWSQLRARARTRGVTPSAVLGAAFADVLATWSGSSHFTLNLMYSDRRPVHPQVGQIVGNFSSTLLLEVNARGATFEDRARAFAALLWADLAHADVTGVRVLREHNALRGARARAAMPVVFSSVLPVTAPAAVADHAVRHLAAPERLTIVHASVQTPQVMLEAVVNEVADALVITWNALDALFSPGVVDAMFDAYCGLVEALAADDARWHAAVRALTPAPQLARYAEVNATDAPLPAGLLHEPFLAAARRTPDATAVVHGRTRLRYHELDRRAAALAHRLVDDGTAHGERVAVVMPKHWAQVVAVLGILEAGAVYVPVDPAMPIERLHYCLRHAQVRRVITIQSVDASCRWPDDVTRIPIDGDDSWAVGSDHAPPPRRATADDLAYVIYTSGSTGVPKGVMIDHRGALNTIADINARFDIGADDRVLALSSLGFDLSVHDVFGTLAAGGTIVLPEDGAAPDPAHWLALIAAERVTVLNAVPALIELVVEHAATRSAGDRDALRLVLMSGDWIPVTLPARLAEVAPSARQISLGGATEASIWSVIYPIGRVDPSWTSIPYGRPLANQRIYVLDEALEPCPMWVRGMIHIAGVGLAQGYLDDDDRTQAAFSTHPRTGERLYRTGDLGRWLPSGDVEILGREDFQVKIQGFRIELAEIEAVLTQDPRIAAAAVIAVGEPRGAKRLVATVVPATGAAVTPDELKAICRVRLPDYMVPPTFVLAAALPLTPNGKIDRRVLATGAPAADMREPVAPRDELERHLVALWSEILDVDGIGVEHDFFALGGNSLLALRLAGRIERELGQLLPLSVLFGAPTIAGLAAAMRRARVPRDWTPLVTVAPGRGRPLFCVHPVGGNVLCFTELARHLDDRPLHALEARGIDDGAPLDRIEDMAAAYVNAARIAQPTGPYLLAGWSMGAVIAFEMARRLEALGQDVALVAMIDPPAPRSRAETRIEPDAVILRMFLLDLARGQRGGPAGPALPATAFDGLAPDAAFDAFLAHATALGVLPPDIDRARVRRLVGVFRAHLTALRAHVPRPWPGRTLLLRAALEAPGGAGELEPVDDVVLGWRRLAPDLTVARIAGDHYSIVREPCVRELARALEAHLAATGNPK